jgi:fluoride exporter
VTAIVWIGVGLLSGAGAIARFALHTAVGRWKPSGFPFGTLAVNILGSASLGVLHGAGAAGDTMLLAGTGLLGSFTTFSTWMIESERLAAEGEAGPAAANIGVSLALGLAAVALGWAVGAAL